MMKDIPHVPPRPQRDRNNQTSSICSEPPKIPPRPIERRSDRSISPHSVSITLSSPYEIPLGQKKYHENSIERSESYELFGAEISRPPSVKLPSLGQEGIEYADAYATEMDIQDKVFTESQNVEIGHKNYASNSSIKTPSLEGSDSMMPFTDSIEGLEKEKHSNANNIGSNENQSHSLPASQTTGRNLSNASNENGIPKIGQIVPMYPNAGDVQAPSQSLEASLATSTLSCDGATQSKHHGRRLSGRPHDILSDAYGRFGHGVISHDRFDKEYYKKHPELFQKESRPYGEDRSEWALSSEDLNKIVRDTASRISMDGGSNVNFGTPSEQIGFQASEEYASRLSSRPSLSRQITNLSSSELKNELPLKTDLSTNNTNPCLKYTSNELEYDKDIDGNHMDGNNIIHVDDPIRSIARAHRDHEDDAYLETAEKVYTNEENDRLGYGAPILAPDEVAKEPLFWELKPAVSPLNENAKTSQEESLYPPETGHQANLTQKSPLIRTANEYNPSNLRSPSLEPLEQLDEYEPLFPEEVKSLSCEPKSMKLVERLKRSEANRRFPSQDVWEDTPNSLQYTATVSTLQSPEDEKNRGNRDEKFERDTETLAHAFAKRQEELAQQEMDRYDNSLPQEKPKKKFTAVPKVEPVTRPKFPNHRFPSRDIWEDTPDSLLLQTTVAGPQIGKDNLNLSEEQPDPTTAEEGNCKTYEYQLNNKSNINTESSPALKSLSADELLKSKSSDNVEHFHSTKPERPAKSLQMHFTERSSSPGLTKPKPQVPARPSKPLSRESSDNLNQKTPPIPAVSVKNKPSLPSRPAGSKIAALQGDFMSDLSKRLQLGPQVSKKDVPKAEQQQENITTPLTDIRKCRARGPARRAPVRAQILHTPNKIPMGEFNPLKVSIVSTIWVFDPKKGYLQVLPSDVGQVNDKILVDPTKI